MKRRQMCFVPTDVMEPTLKKGSRIVIDLAHYLTEKPQRWDLVVLGAPELESLGEKLGQVRIPATKCGAIANAACDIFEEQRGDPVPFLPRPHIFYVKRIVGLPGERIAFTESAILRNGKPLEVPPALRKVYRGFSNHTKFKFGAKEHAVPRDSIFVLSDNHEKGKDSREIGHVKMDYIFARVVR
jgi:signal peptidase I